MATLSPVKVQACADPVAESMIPPLASPAVVILNMFYSGLGIARDMAGKGVRVLGLSADRTIYGNFTRLCEIRWAPNSQEEPAELAAMLLKLSSELRGAVIFPTRDADVLLLERYRDTLSPHYRLAIPPSDCLLRVMNKHALAVAAESAGIPVPRTTVVSSRAELHRVEMEVGFPCVLKPVFAVDWRGAENWRKVGARKAIPVNDRHELECEYERLSEIDREVLVQQRIPGSSDQIVVLGGYVRSGGELADYFTARKLVQSPDDFGTGCVVESEQIAEIIALSKRLCRALDYEGMAEIEYKYDSESREFRLIEINTRHWDWHRLGSASDINLSWTAYCDLTGRSLDSQPRPVTRAKWIAEDALLIYMLRGLYRRRLRVRDVWKNCPADEFTASPIGPILGRDFATSWGNFCLTSRSHSCESLQEVCHDPAAGEECGFRGRPVLRECFSVPCRRRSVGSRLGNRNG
jgi:D-aspartate ligase